VLVRLREMGEGPCEQEDIEADRGLLARAKDMGKGDQMSREEYGALKRKVSGGRVRTFGEGK
jgi:hypothetical protein